MPFKGQSTNAKEFGKRRAEAVEKVIPLGNVSKLIGISACASLLPLRDFQSVEWRFHNSQRSNKILLNKAKLILRFLQLIVPHGMSMPTKSEHRSKFDEKPIREENH